MSAVIHRLHRSPRALCVLLGAAPFVCFFSATALSDQTFVRGRINDDAAIDISDPIFALDYLFLGGETPRCLKAADVNDDGAVDISDPVYLLFSLFQAGPNPPPPYPDPGTDPTADGLTCFDQAVTDLAVDPYLFTLSQLGETRQLAVSGKVGGVLADLTSSTTGTTYQTSDPKVALVYRDGLVESKASGSATITVQNRGASAQASLPVTIGALPTGYIVLAANDLGMHCVDREFSIYSILPPFNVFHAQVVRRTAGGMPAIVDGTEATLRYSPVVDARGSLNMRSIGKSDFWDHVQQLFGAALAPGQGLLGAYMADDAPQAGPQPMAYNAANRWFSGEGVPALDTDDGGAKNSYPLIRVTARNPATQEFLARLDIVVPVSSETDCQNCHATGGIAASGAGVTWATDADREVQTKKNVLLLHDQRIGTNLMGQRPVLCARCHYSRALDLSGAGPQGSQIGKVVFSEAMHRFHGNLVDGAQQPVFPPLGDALSTCHQCHPGRITRCLRGSMASAGLECRNCHGDMRATGGQFPLAAGGSTDGQNDGGSRRPWFDLPRCQSCHTGDAVEHLSGAGLVAAPDGIRLSQAYQTGDLAASPILAVNKRFAENDGTLFRFSKGHGGLACESCHGSTHAEWAVADPAANDNVAASQLQGHTGRVMECGVCHAAGTLGRVTGGPHGLHNVNDQGWANGGHENFYRSDPQGCKACHGASLEGTALARVAADRTFNVEEAGTVHLAKGSMVSCDLCHGRPGL